MLWRRGSFLEVLMLWETGSEIKLGSVVRSGKDYGMRRKR